MGLITCIGTSHIGNLGSQENICKAKLRDYTIALYKKCAAYALSRGIIIADTKFESVSYTHLDVYKRQHPSS